MRNKIILAVISAICGMTASVNAASVSWQTPFEVAAGSDLKVAGRNVVYAINGGDNDGYTTNEPTPTAGSPFNVTVGSTTVTFEGLAGLYGPTSKFASTTFGDLTDHLPGSGAKATFGVLNTNGGTMTVPNVNWASTVASGSRIYTPVTDNADLDTLLNSMMYCDGRVVGSSALVISLNDLTPGKEYQIQLIGAADARPRRSGQPAERNESTSTVDGGTTIIGAYQDLNSDGQFHVTSTIGTFTADATSQVINVTLANGRNPGISGLILTTAVPEPASIGTAVVGASLLLMKRRRAE